MLQNSLCNMIEIMRAMKPRFAVKEADKVLLGKDYKENIVMSKYIIKEVFDKTSKPVNKLLLEVFKEYCINNYEKIQQKAVKKKKDVI